MALRYIIQSVYGLRDFQIVGDPPTLAILADGYSARYNIEASAGDSATEARMKEMAKALLADRFALRVHNETRDLPVYALIPAKGGIKLQSAKDNGRPRGSGGVAFMMRGWIQGANVSFPQFILAVSESVDRPVIDKSGFTDAFDFRLTWTPDSGAEPDAPKDGTCPPSFAAFVEQRKMDLHPATWSCPSIFTAVQDQLGLRLDARKEPIEVLVIDHAERPSSN